MTDQSDPYGITQAIERVGADVEGLYLGAEQHAQLLDYVLWNAALDILKQVSTFVPSRLREQFGDGTNFRADRETVQDLENLLVSIMREGAKASTAKADYALYILRGGRWSQQLAEFVAPAHSNYYAPELLLDVIGAAAALAMIKPGGTMSLEDVHATATRAATIARTS